MHLKKKKMMLELMDTDFPPMILQVNRSSRHPQLVKPRLFVCRKDTLQLLPRVVGAFCVLKLHLTISGHLSFLTRK